MEFSNIQELIIKAHTDNTYADTYQNRKLGRVGQPYKKGPEKQKNKEQTPSKGKEKRSSFKSIAKKSLDNFNELLDILAPYSQQEKLYKDISNGKKIQAGLKILARGATAYAGSLAIIPLSIEKAIFGIDISSEQFFKDAKEMIKDIKDTSIAKKATSLIQGLKKSFSKMKDMLNKNSVKNGYKAFSKYEIDERSNYINTQNRTKLEEALKENKIPFERLKNKRGTPAISFKVGKIEYSLEGGHLHILSDTKMPFYEQNSGINLKILQKQLNSKKANSIDFTKANLVNTSRGAFYKFKDL